MALGGHLVGHLGGKRRVTLRVTCENSIASFSLLKTVITHADGEVSRFVNFFVLNIMASKPSA